MDISEFDYSLPPELIAQSPVEPRDSSRMLVVHRDTRQIEHRIFREIGEYLQPGDLLVANQSRVLPARLLGEKAGTGGQVELLLLSIRGDLGRDVWEGLVRPGRRIREGQVLSFGDGALQATVLSRTESGGRVVQLAAANGDVATTLKRIGTTPLPPYIHERLADAERYQTIYARTPGSAAAPTAGLHFTPHLLDELQRTGIGIAFVTLHIGLDTFRPIGDTDLTTHKMHSEEIELDAETAARINATRDTGGRIIAVGTTSVRVLETAASLAHEQAAMGSGDPAAGTTPTADTAAAGERQQPVVVPFRGRTALFIKPGHVFRAVDAMITNFHLPRSTLVVLVSAFAGRELILRAYEEAVRERYRFYSFGDAMLLL